MIPLFIGAALIGAGIADDISTFKREAREAQDEAERLISSVNRQVNSARDAANDEIARSAQTKIYVTENCYKDFINYYEQIRNLNTSDFYIDITDLIDIRNAIDEIDRLVISSGGVENISQASLAVLGAYGVAEVGAALGVSGAASAAGILGTASTFAAPLALIGGYFARGEAKEAREKALENLSHAKRKYEEGMNTCSKFNAIGSLLRDTNNVNDSLYKKFYNAVYNMTETIKQNNYCGRSWRQYSPSERAQIKHTAKFAVAFKNVLNARMYNPKTLEIYSEGRQALTEGRRLLNSVS